MAPTKTPPHERLNLRVLLLWRNRIRVAVDELTLGMLELLFLQHRMHFQTLSSERTRRRYEMMSMSTGSLRDFGRILLKTTAGRRFHDTTHNGTGVHV